MTKYNNLNIRQKLLTKHNIKEKQTAHKMKACLCIERMGWPLVGWTVCIKKKYCCAQLQKTGANVWMKNKLGHWQENKTFLCCGPNQKDERDFKFSDTLHQSLGQYILKKAEQKMLLFWGKLYCLQRSNPVWWLWIDPILRK